MKCNSLLKGGRKIFGIRKFLQDIKLPNLMTRYFQDLDVAKTKIADAKRLDRVGMSEIECPVIIDIKGYSQQLAAAKADAFVSLDEPQKGIHMSRLFIALTESLAKEPVSPLCLEKIAGDFLSTHDGISASAHIKVSFDLLMQRPALRSANKGWRSYPVSLWTTISGGRVQNGAEVTIRYSSTCPCSAALARQLIQNKFAESFLPNQMLARQDIIDWLGKEESIAGTPHGQRSEGNVKVLLRDNPNNLDFLVHMIENLENTLGTPVQAAVKRADEQEFARLNAANLMFSEDAVRRMSAAVASNPMFIGTACEVRHFESLHPHDAVAKISTGELVGRVWL
jgi:GTP cyclohydrolase IB